MQANRATFFFRLVNFRRRDGVVDDLTLEQERELEKVNKFYLQKEAEVCNARSASLIRSDLQQLKLRLSSLLEQKRSMQAQQTPASRLSSRYIALEDGFRQFSADLSKLQVRLWDKCGSTSLNVSSNSLKSMRPRSQRFSKRFEPLFSARLSCER